MISSQITILEQAELYLRTTTTAQYIQIIQPLFISSAGGHMRHILDHYQALMDGLETQFIDYDKRSRGSDIELNPVLALDFIAKIKTFLYSLSDAQLNLTVQLSTEVSVSEQRVQVVSSTFARELIFAGSHAIHHFAMIDQIAKAQKKGTIAQFGIAPATATFLRNEKCAH